MLKNITMFHVKDHVSIPNRRKPMGNHKTGAMAHHAHQELVRGMTTEMSGPTLAKVEIMHWCESVLFLGWVGMFTVWAGPATIVVAVVVALFIYLIEIWIDNNFARVKWQAMLGSAWSVALVAGGVNIAALVLL